MSEQAPERAPQQAPPAQASQPPQGGNVFTRKIGPLPMWAWLAIAAALILGYVVFFGKKKGTGSGGAAKRGARGPRGFGRFLQPHVPHIHHHARGDHMQGAAMDEAAAASNDQMAAATSAGAAGPGPGHGADVPVGLDRRDKRGEPSPGWLVQFKTAEAGQTPSLADVANHYGTDPEAIVQEAEGRGYPASVAWKRYVARHDWASPLPPATDFSILARPG